MWSFECLFITYCSKSFYKIIKNTPNINTKNGAKAVTEFSIDGDSNSVFASSSVLSTSSGCTNWITIFWVTEGFVKVSGVVVSVEFAEVSLP